MAFFPVFLSIVYVVRNQGHQLESIVQRASEKLSSLVSDYELISLSNEGPLYHVGQEFTSTRMTRREKLNIEEVSLSAKSVSSNSDQVVA